MWFEIIQNQIKQKAKNINRKSHRKVTNSNQNSRLSWVSLIELEQPGPGAPLLGLHTLLYLPSDFRLACAANISEHLTIRRPHRELRLLLFSISVWVLLRSTELIMKSCETGSSVYRVYLARED